MGTDPIMSLDELVTALSQPLESRSVHGVLHDQDDDGNWFTQRIYLRGDMYRVEDERAGGIITIRGEKHFWVRADNDNLDYAFGPEGPHHDFAGGTLARRRTPEYWREWLGTDPQIVRSTMDATELLGRIAVRFTMPEVKGERPVLTMDASTGIVLRSEREDLGVLTEWQSFSTEPLERHLFGAPVRH